MEVNEVKRCSSCKEKKSLNLFYRSKRSSDGYLSVCKKCNDSSKKELVKNNPEKAKLINRKGNLKKFYGLTIEDYEKKLKEQDGRCAICGSYVNGDSGRSNLCVDHDHYTNLTRGLLCSNCNRGLGCFKEDLQTLNNAVSYLLKWKR